MTNLNLSSELEWQLLQELWKKSPQTAKQLWQLLYPDEEKSYSTVITYLNRMVDKEILSMHKIGNVNLYDPAVTEDTAKSSATQRFVSRVFQGSFGRLASFLVETDKLTAEEIEELEAFFEEMRRGTDD
ncbi:MAG: hypothetical protein GF372_12480 [Candidatus Marinimicrobia bacterium]|nr:hypothetical protein [Candidatus Neomarinimicrobiota bacterium]